MSAQLIDLSPDLKRLKDEGLVMEVRDNHLIIHRVPYLNSQKEILYGKLITSLQQLGIRTQPNPEHTMWFVGEEPCRLDGTPFTTIINSSNKQQIIPDLIADFYLSAKPAQGYPDYYEKVRTYLNIITAPAKAVDSSVTEKGESIRCNEALSVFKYSDTNSSKPELNYLNDRFRQQKIGIIGLGGTGSYILDLICKTHVAEIHLFDGDYFYNNNAFRSPGAASLEEDLITTPKKKVTYYQGIYSKMREGIVCHPHYINSSNITELAFFDFFFISIDDGDSRKMILKYLEEQRIPFIDAGMGISNNKDALTGLIRVTTGIPGSTSHLWEGNNIPYRSKQEEEYDSNIQIAELNCLNASLAVIKWKKLIGYYHDVTKEKQMLFSLNANRVINAETGT